MSPLPTHFAPFDAWVEAGPVPPAGRWRVFRTARGLVMTVAALLLGSCGQESLDPEAGADTPELATHGAVEVTARLVEVPAGAIFERDLYDYATILQYQVLEVHRGEVRGDTLYVGHYNPWKPRREAADRRVKNVGGSIRQFEAGQVHRLALEVPIEDHFMGGIVNKYFGRDTGPIYWAVWTCPARE